MSEDKHCPDLLSCCTHRDDFDDWNSSDDDENIPGTSCAKHLGPLDCADRSSFASRYIFSLHEEKKFCCSPYLRGFRCQRLIVFLTTITVLIFAILLRDLVSYAERSQRVQLAQDVLLESLEEEHTLPKQPPVPESIWSKIPENYHNNVSEYWQYALGYENFKPMNKKRDAPNLYAIFNRIDSFAKVFKYNEISYLLFKNMKMYYIY